MKNHYDVLELDKNCTAKEVKDSYLKLSKKYHPDKNKSDEAQRKIVEINEAYTVLKNASTRCTYDENLKNKTEQQQYQKNFHQKGTNYNYNRPRSYEEYVQYYQKVNLRASENSNVGKFTLVLCCCMLMMFGAGVRIMYAWSEAYRRRALSEEAARKFSEPIEPSENPKMERIQQIWKKKLENKLKNKKNSE